MISQPRNEKHSMGSSSVEVIFSGSLAADLNKDIKQRQDIIDKDVLRLCSSLMPIQTGRLIRSGTAKNGVVEYTAPYARAQYYNTKESRSYDAKRGGRWFERMKTSHKTQILQKARKG